MDIVVCGLSFKVLHDMRKTWVLAEEGQVKDMVKLFQDAHRVVVAKPAKAESAGVAPKMEDGDKGKVRYNAVEHCFEVRYQGADGKLHQHRKDLRVPTHDMCGKELTPEAFEDALKMIKQRAQSLWNEMDKSEHARF